MSYNNNDLGKILKQQRITVPLTLQELAAESGVSSSHLGRIERGERFPSARILRKIAKPLGFDEDELFTLAGFLSPQTSGVAEESSTATAAASWTPMSPGCSLKNPRKYSAPSSASLAC